MGAATIPHVGARGETEPISNRAGPRGARDPAQEGLERERLTDSVDYIVLYARDLETSVAFYRDVVGLAVKLEGDGYVEFVTRGTKFGLYDRARLGGLIGREATDGGPAGQLVFLVRDADAQAERLQCMGVEILAGPVDRPWGHRTLHVPDPDGNVVEFAQEIPRAEPARRQERLQP